MFLGASGTVRRRGEHLDARHQRLVRAADNPASPAARRRSGSGSTAGTRRARTRPTTSRCRARAPRRPRRPPTTPPPDHAADQPAAPAADEPARHRGAAEAHPDRLLAQLRQRLVEPAAARRPGHVRRGRHRLRRTRPARRARSASPSTRSCRPRSAATPTRTSPPTWHAARPRQPRSSLSVGGELGTISVNDAASANASRRACGLIMTGSGSTASTSTWRTASTRRSWARRCTRSRAASGSGFILTLAPQTIDMQSTGGAYFQLALAVRDILTTVHTQYYNSGTMLGCDGKVYAQGTVDFLTALACIQLQGGLRPDQVALGLPASSRAAGGGAVAPSVVDLGADLPGPGRRLRLVPPADHVAGHPRRDDLVGQLGPGAGVRVREHRGAGAGPAAVTGLRGGAARRRPTPRPGRPCSPRRAAWTRSPAGPRAGPRRR